MKKVFLDANIILDFLDSQRERHKESAETVRIITEAGWITVITEDLLTTIYYIIRNKRSLLDFYSIILDEWEIVSFGKQRLDEAVSICKDNSETDFEDVIQSLSARDSGCSLIITNDTGFYFSGVKTISSTEFIALQP